MAHWGMSSVWIHPQFDPVALAIGPLAVRWYGLMYLLGFLAFLTLGRWQLRRDVQASGMRPADLDDFLMWGVLGVVLGGRLGYVVFYKPLEYLAHPEDILMIWKGGMAFHGGLIGVVVAMALFAWRRPHLARTYPNGPGCPPDPDTPELPDIAPASWRLRFLALSDFVAPLVPLGLAFGRLGNFINGELWGRPADPASIPWAMIFPQSGTDLARHPSQLYQMAGEGIALFLILFWLSQRPRPRGFLAASFLLGYGFFRFVTEFAREPDAFLGLLGAGLSMGQWLSLPMMLLGLGLLTWVCRSAQGRESTDC